GRSGGGGEARGDEIVEVLAGAVEGHGAGAGARGGLRVGGGADLVGVVVDLAGRHGGAARGGGGGSEAAGSTGDSGTTSAGGGGLLGRANEGGGRSMAASCD